MIPTPGLPADCRTKLECRDCKGEAFRVCWNWTPGGDPAAARWDIDCISCGAGWVLHPGGLPTPGEIHDSKVDVRLFHAPPQAPMPSPAILPPVTQGNASGWRDSCYP